MKFRSAITGRWVTRLFARTNPATTVSEKEAKKETGYFNVWSDREDNDE